METAAEKVSSDAKGCQPQGPSGPQNAFLDNMLQTQLDNTQLFFQHNWDVFLGEMAQPLDVTF